MNRKLAILFSVGILALPVMTLASVGCEETTEGCTAAQYIEFANAPSTSAPWRIQYLQKAISKLTEQIAKLGSSNTTTASSACLVLNNALVIGSTDATTNGEVSKLQQFLVAAGVYPEARITGYYGMLTAQAVVRWQKAHGMDFVTTSSGVGPMTREKLRTACTNANATTKNYTNTKYGYSIQYPSTWYINTSGSNDDISAQGGPERGGSVFRGGDTAWSPASACGQVADQTSWFCIQLQIYDINANSWDEKFWERNVWDKQENIQIASGQTGQIVSNAGKTTPPIVFAANYAFIKKGDKMFVFQLSTSGAEPSPDLRKLWENMIRSLSFQ